MKTAADHFQHIIGNFINQTMFAINASRPATLQLMFQWLRFSNPRKWCALYFFYLAMH